MHPASCILHHAFYILYPVIFIRVNLWLNNHPPSSVFAFCTTFSTVKPNFTSKTSKGADAPYPHMPMKFLSLTVPRYLSQPKGPPASIPNLLVTFGGKTESLYP